MGSQGAGILFDFLDGLRDKQQLAALGVYVYKAGLANSAVGRIGQL
jgi:hypothetical protein